MNKLIRFPRTEELVELIEQEGGAKQFCSWLEGQQQEVVGRRNSAVDCPIYRWLQSLGHRPLSVGPGMVTVAVMGGACRAHYTGHPWVTGFIASMDSLEDSQALILGEVALHHLYRASPLVRAS